MNWQQRCNLIDYTDMKASSDHQYWAAALLEGAFQSALSKEENALVVACAKEMESHAALNSFKTRNQISDPAHYPADQLFHFSLLIMFVAIETIINAFFYQGSSGLLGGAVVALSISAVNMSLAAALGCLYRYVNLPKTREKITGYSGIIFFVILALVLNLIFSTFRVQYPDGHPNSATFGHLKLPHLN